jgi:hypothetical protein
VATAVVGVTACGDDTTVRTTEPCEAGNNECVSDKVGRACPEGPEPGWVYFACGDTEICQMGACVFDEDQSDRLGLCSAETKECVSEALARQCSKAGDAWLPLACAAGTTCQGGDCVPVGADGGGGVQICNPGAVQCATEYAVKTCQNDGSEWIVSLCQAGEVCENGACVQNRDGACVPNTSQCLDATSGLRCRDDGQGYDEFECPPEAPCDGFKCLGEVCTPGETKCPDPADELQEALGPAAVQGHYFAGDEVFKCNSTGSGWDVIPCALDELCVYDSLTRSESAAYEDLYLTYFQDYLNAKAANGGDPYSTVPYPTAPVFVYPPNRFMEASCVVPDCEFALGKLDGDMVCGDPADEAVDKQAFYSRCEGLAPFSNPQWVPYTCTAPEMCDPNAYYAEDPCTTDCIPGEVICGYFFGGDDDSVYGCNADGEWEPQESCNPGVDKALTCFQQYPDDAGGVRSAMCVDPLCKYIWDNYSNSDTEYGFCQGSEIRQCDENGMVVPAAEAMPCASGSCYDSGYTYDENGSGYTLGWCEEECTDGETRCVDNETYHINYYGWGYAYTPFYMTCVDGVWNRTQYDACLGEAPGETQTCFQILEPAQEGEMIQKVVCGGECQPTFRECSMTDDTVPVSGVRTCGDDAMWGETEACAVGSCRNEHSNSNFWDAECVFDCVPGTFDWYTEYLEDAGATYYNSVECGEDGRWGTVDRCDGDISQFWVDQTMGCFECYGPELAYYWSQVQGYEVKVESKCDLDGNIVWCGADNTWPTQGQACPAGNTCYTYNTRNFPPYQSYAAAYCAVAPPTPDAGDGG